MAVKPIPKRGAKNPVSRRWEKLNNINFLSVFDPAPPKPLPRQVFVNQVLPEEARTTEPKFSLPFWRKKTVTILPDGSEMASTAPRGFGGAKVVPAEGWDFSSNQVLTSKYNIITFLPRNLLEQVSTTPSTRAPGSNEFVCWFGPSGWAVRARCS